MAVNMHMEDTGGGGGVSGLSGGLGGAAAAAAEVGQEEDGVRAPIPQKQEVGWIVTNM